MRDYPFLLGLDVGTTHTKGVLLDPQVGRIVAEQRVPTPSYEPRPGWREYDPMALWSSARSCIRTLMETAPPSGYVAALAIASMGEAGTLYDDHGHALCPIIAWHDPRTRPQRDWWAKARDGYELYDTTGQHPMHILSACKLVWIRDNWPAAWRQARYWRCIEDGIVWQLCREHATDHTIASRTMLFDQRLGAWAEELLQAAGVSASMLPALHPSGHIVGRVTSEAAGETGLAEGTPVVTGGHDHLCAALACGCIAPDAFLDSAGTSESMLWITESYAPTRELYALGYSHYRHTVAGTYVIQGGVDTSGAFLAWTAKLLGLKTDPVGHLIEMATASTPGANGVIATPFLLGRGTPYRDASARAALVGLGATNAPADVARAALESLAYWLAGNLEALRQLRGKSPEAIIATGGTNRSSFLCQLKADVTGLPVQAPDLPEAAALGAALLAGMGISIYASAREAHAALSYGSRQHTPDAERHLAYKRLRRQRYDVLNESLRPFHHNKPPWP